MRYQRLSARGARDRVASERSGTGRDGATTSRTAKRSRPKRRVSDAPRLILVDSVVVDVVLNVEALPERGSDTLVERSDSFAGGGFNVMAAASRLGLASVYGGVVGLGPFATIAQEAMREENIVVATAPNDDVDTGFVLAIVEDDGGRPFLTCCGRWA